MKKIFIVIAALNEEKKIGSVISSIKKQGYLNIVVVDDGSTDKTADAAKKAGAKVISHVINRGQGASLQTGIKYALKNSADVIVTFDADGQQDPKEIKSITKPIIDGRCDVTLGSRFLNKKSNTPIVRKLTLKAGTLFMWVIYGIKLSDAHNGFRGLSRKAAQKIEIKQDRFEHASEIVDQVNKKKLRYKEVPVTVKYTDYSREKGQSSLASIKMGFKLIFKKFFS